MSILLVKIHKPLPEACKILSNRFKIKHYREDDTCLVSVKEGSNLDKFLTHAWFIKSTTVN